MLFTQTTDSKKTNYTKHFVNLFSTGEEKLLSAAQTGI
jgi:hypothetical protein